MQKIPSMVGSEKALFTSEARTESGPKDNHASFWLKDIKQVLGRTHWSRQQSSAVDCRPVMKEQLELFGYHVANTLALSSVPLYNVPQFSYTDL